jgi:cobaltochelatase CobN
MYERRRNLVVRPDGRPVNVARFRGQLFVCASGCCCGRVGDGFHPVPEALFHTEWERRRLRNLVHLTIGGCLGPCALANVVMLLFDGQAYWYHSVDSEALVLAIYDHVERMLEAGGCLPPPPALRPHHFTASAWQPRPDGQPVDDHRPRRRPASGSPARPCLGEPAREAATARVDQLIAGMQAAAALPRRNGELVFEAPWQGRAFGMAVALHERGLFVWQDFRQELIARIAAAEAGPGPFSYYEAWLAALETVLDRAGLVTGADLEESTFQFEFGERDDVF